MLTIAVMIILFLSNFERDDYSVFIRLLFTSLYQFSFYKLYRVALMDILKMTCPPSCGFIAAMVLQSSIPVLTSVVPSVHRTVINGSRRCALYPSLCHCSILRLLLRRRTNVRNVSKYSLFYGVEFTYLSLLASLETPTQLTLVYR